LHVPGFISFEAPFPGTPFFHRLAAERGQPAFLPNALLRDFTSYTLVVRPRHCSPEDFVQAWRDTLREVYRPARRLAKLVDDLPPLLRRGSWSAAVLDVAEQWRAGMPDVPGRSHLAGTDLPPPERVPFGPQDFKCEAEQLAVCSPTVVTDGQGRILPAWAAARDGQSSVSPVSLMP
jgi:hypothetical protein